MWECKAKKNRNDDKKHFFLKKIQGTPKFKYEFIYNAQKFTRKSKVLTF